MKFVYVRLFIPLLVINILLFSSCENHKLPSSEPISEKYELYGKYKATTDTGRELSDLLEIKEGGDLYDLILINLFYDDLFVSYYALPLRGYLSGNDIHFKRRYCEDCFTYISPDGHVIWQPYDINVSGKWNPEEKSIVLTAVYELRGSSGFDGKIYLKKID